MTAGQLKLSRRPEDWGNCVFETADVSNYEGPVDALERSIRMVADFGRRTRG